MIDKNAAEPLSGRSFVLKHLECQKLQLCKSVRERKISCQLLHASPVAAYPTLDCRVQTNPLQTLRSGRHRTIRVLSTVPAPAYIETVPLNRRVIAVSRMEAKFSMSPSLHPCSTSSGSPWRRLSILMVSIWALVPATARRKSSWTPLLRATIGNIVLALGLSNDNYLCNKQPCTFSR
jgi:hypothetical protein